MFCLAKFNKFFSDLNISVCLEVPRVANFVYVIISIWWSNNESYHENVRFHNPKWALNSEAVRRSGGITLIKNWLSNSILTFSFSNIWEHSSNSFVIFFTRCKWEAAKVFQLYWDSIICLGSQGKFLSSNLNQS